MKLVCLKRVVVSNSGKNLKNVFNPAKCFLVVYTKNNFPALKVMIFIRFSCQFFLHSHQRRQTFH